LAHEHFARVSDKVIPDLESVRETTELTLRALGGGAVGMDTSDEALDAFRGEEAAEDYLRRIDALIFLSEQDRIPRDAEVLRERRLKFFE